MTELQRPGHSSIPYAKFCGASAVRKETTADLKEDARNHCGLDRDETDAPSKERAVNT